MELSYFQISVLELWFERHLCLLRQLACSSEDFSDEQMEQIDMLLMFIDRAQQIKETLA